MAISALHLTIKKAPTPTAPKIPNIFASLPTSGQQFVFALLVPSCQKVWDIS